MSHPPRLSVLDRYRGCLLGGAVGDALGAAVEFLTDAQIRNRFGAGGIMAPAEAYGRVGAITDDTQMTLFTAEGLLQADDRLEHGTGYPPFQLWAAYQRWLFTQGERPGPLPDEQSVWHGELHQIASLRSPRAPGQTCISALKQCSVFQRDDETAANDSKGCGGVMRAAPCGLVSGWGVEPFGVGDMTARWTHGHPTGHTAAGSLASIIAALKDGASLQLAVHTAIDSVDGEVHDALRKARALSNNARPSANAISTLGQGWVAEEALAIAVYSVLAHPNDFAASVRLAANHSGDSDSTAAIAGNIAGTWLGVQAIPGDWLDVLELRETIDRLARALHDRFVIRREDLDWDLWQWPDYEDAATQRLAPRPETRGSGDVQDNPGVGAQAHTEPAGSRRHHNVFMYYRGPSAKKETELDAHRQIEDNATKALVNVLEHGVPNLTHSFAERFAPTVAGDWPPDIAASFYLQGGPHKPPAGPRILLGLSITGALDPNALPAKAEAHGRIDAAIVSPHGRLIAVETKVVDLLDPHQLARHCKDWNIAFGDTILARWVDVWAWGRDARADTSDGVSRFLLGQFCEYLEILGFGRWVGFREKDFAQFANWSWHHQPVLRARMSACWERILELMPEHHAAWLGKIESGRLPKGQTHAWAQTNRGQKGTNLTLQLHADELQFNVDGWNAVQARRLATWLIAHPADAPDLDLVIHERRAKRDHKGKPFWMGAAATTLMTFTADEVRAGDFSKWFEQWHSEADHTWTRLAYHLRHAWPRHEVLTRGEHIGPEIAALAAQSVLLLRAINGWKVPPPSSEMSPTVKRLAESSRSKLGLAQEGEDMGGLEFEGNYGPTGPLPQILEVGEEPKRYDVDGKLVED